ncbi:hypothetical protein BDN70DRAFT_880646 [Pholiota conissans]|uniref:Uncharacterized protein n=1 Tax=Pholiota conissans TaxID=109636 RepID=A0A9P6CS71_9AGAR|nr:hypothetical protein BDN70DRAFT_880646 [Pholiota conissans]
MPATSAAVSLSSSSSVAGQQSPALKASSDYEERSSLHSMPGHDWDMQGFDDVQESNIIEYYPSSSPPETPGLSWDSRPTSAALSAPALKSVFDDWDDPFPTQTNPAIVVEEDGVQTVLIPADSPFFSPPSPYKPFGYAPFSTGLLAEKVPSSREPAMDDAAAITPILINKTLSTTATHLPSDQKINSKGLTLFVDATFLQPTFGSDAMLSSPIFSTPSLRVDNSSWAPKGFMSGPDVPLDCIYTAGDFSPIAEHWEGAWSPIVRGPFRSAPCV